MKVWLRCDADARIGLGHLVRTIAVGEALAREGAECVVVTRSAPSDLPDLPFPVLRIDGERAWPEPGVTPEIADVVIADLYRPTESELLALRRGPWLLAFLDDESPLRFDCDLLVNPNLDRSFTHAHTPATRYLRGGEAIILREQFHDLPAHALRPVPLHLLVCLGGGDQSSLLEALVAALPGRAPVVPPATPVIDRLTVVIGPAYSRRAELESRVAARGGRVLVGVKEMAPLMSEADVGLFAAGTLLYEAMASGLPSLVVAVTDGQAREAQVADEAGAVLTLAEPSAVAVEEALFRLADPARRGAMARAGKALIDGRGGHRIAAQLTALHRRRSRP